MNRGRTLSIYLTMEHITFNIAICTHLQSLPHFNQDVSSICCANSNLLIFSSNSVHHVLLFVCFVLCVFL